MTRNLLAPVILAAVIAMLALAGTSTADRGRSGRSALDVQLTLATQAAAALSTPAAAQAAGYVPVSPCIQSPFGIMGFHFANPALEASGVLDPARPPQLTLVPTAAGLVLGALEYYKVDADQNLATDDDRPSLFGVPFDGPMPGHGPMRPIHYDLHVWVGLFNPNGIFQQWNPLYNCPA